MIRTSSEPCQAHRHHETVTPYYTELHHVIPQAWQFFWRPPTAKVDLSIDAYYRDALGMEEPPGGPMNPVGYHEWRQSGGQPTIWDKRTVPICPTGHRNVHWLLVRFMKEWAKLGDHQQSFAAIMSSTIMTITDIRREGLKVNRGEAHWAREAMVRWNLAGGSLAALCDAHMWGEA